MSKSIEKLLESADETALKVAYGFAWRERATREILSVWRALPWHKRAWQTILGNRPVA